MIFLSVSANHLELASEDAVELLRITTCCASLGVPVSAERLVRVTLTFIREDLTNESGMLGIEGDNGEHEPQLNLL